MNESRATALAIQKKRKAMWDDRVMGMSVGEIARKNRISARAVYQHLNASVSDMDATKWLERHLDITLERLEMLLASYFPIALGDKAKGIEPDKSAADFCLNVIRRQSAMLGLDAPKKVDIRGYIERWSLKEGLDPDDVAEVLVGMFPEI